MRTKNSIFNMIATFGSQIIMTLLGFLSRTIFITTLGSEYLGINGLFTNILSIISLAESGIGSSIVFSLYKPVAENDEEKIQILMNVYRKAFTIIGFIVFIIGLAIMPFLRKFMNGDTTVENLYLIYFIFIFNSAITYLFSYKISFLNVCQKNYVVTSITTGFSVAATIMKILILYFTQNYILFLVVDSIITIVTQVMVSRKADKLYPYLKNKTDKKLDNETKGSIIKNMKALVVHNIGGRAVFGTDNLLISSFVSVASVGLYNNYLMFINLFRNLINTVFNAVEDAFGDLIAQEDNNKTYDVYKAANLCVFWLNSFFAIGMYICLEPAMEIWLGKKYLMGQTVVAVLMVSFYVSGMRRAINIVKSKAGIFHEDRFAPLFEAAVNLISSIILVKFFGISGVFLGTIISTLAVPFWIAPYLVYKKVFNKSPWLYFLEYIIYTIIGLVTCILTVLVCSFIPNNGMIAFLGKVIVAGIIPNIIYILIFHKTKEFKYLWGVADTMVFSKFKRKTNSENELGA